MTHLAKPLTPPFIERSSDKAIFTEDARNECGKLSMRTLMIISGILTVQFISILIFPSIPFVSSFENRPIFFTRHHGDDYSRIGGEKAAARGS